MNLAVVSLLLPAGCVPVGLDGFVLVVNGGVADGGGAPVVGAEVELLGDTGAVMGSTTSDEAGRLRRIDRISAQVAPSARRIPAMLSSL